jgi:diguanylate cyclase (GGDEF)-like protein/PAS domain S-box-containing protein
MEASSVTARTDMDGFWAALVACRGNLPEVLRVVGRQVTDTLGDGSVLTMLDPNGRVLHPVAVFHKDPVVAQAMEEALGGADVEVGSGVAGSVAAERRPVVLNDMPPSVIEETVHDQFVPFTQMHPIRALAIVPLLAAGELMGTLGAVRTESSAPYGPEDVRRLEVLAERAALAIADATSTPRRIGHDDFEALFAHSVDGLMITTPDGHILAANPSACSMLDRTEREILEQGREGLVVADQALRDALDERAAFGRVRAELTMRRGDGTTFVADVTSAIFTTHSGAPRACIIFRDIDDAVAARERDSARMAELEARADRDDLTGLWNRQGWATSVEQALAIADRRGFVSQLLFIDVDDLKGINDRLGHAAGDAAIAAVGQALVRETRGADVVCRSGGDEFLVLLVDARPEDVAGLSERLRDAVAADERAPGVTVTIGSVERRPGTSTPIGQLVEQADHAMYSHKVVGRLRRT